MSAEAAPGQAADAAAGLHELRLLAPEAEVETLCEALEALDALSVVVEDADADTPAERGLFGEPGLPASAAAWAQSRLTALFASAALAQEALELLLAQPFFAHCRVLELRALPEADWVQQTQAQFEPVPITPGFWIVPGWHAVPAAAGRVIRLDPGQAFGTGTHPTTQMCLRWIARHGCSGQRVLDYGCGSGILAIAAALHAAAAVLAVDIDPVAVATAHANAARNQVPVQTGLPEVAQDRFDLVLANILASPLQVLAPLLCAHLAEGAHLVLAGILERQTAELQAAYAPWVPLQVSDAQEGWVLLTAQRAR